MEKKESFVLYKNWYEPIKNLSDASLGKILRAIFEIQINGMLITELEPELIMAFNFMQTQFKLDAERYRLKCEKNKEIAMMAKRK
ncbi:MAG: hypothetical protein K0B37_17210 [Bacteroidales bacterium]|jgi:hypothetical protein|nr:hypothetical protein [Bacteroidales bacterium]